jgi:hypothetical protein
VGNAACPLLRGGRSLIGCCDSSSHAQLAVEVYSTYVCVMCWLLLLLSCRGAGVSLAAVERTGKKPEEAKCAVNFAVSGRGARSECHHTVGRGVITCGTTALPPPPPVGVLTPCYRNVPVSGQGAARGGWQQWTAGEQMDEEGGYSTPAQGPACACCLDDEDEDVLSTDPFTPVNMYLLASGLRFLGNCSGPGCESHG